MIGQVSWAGSTAVVDWIPRLLLQLIVRTQISLSAALFGGEDADPNAAGRGKQISFLQAKPSNQVDVSASHQTRLDTRSMAQRSIMGGLKEGKVRLELRLEPCRTMLVICQLKAKQTWLALQDMEPNMSPGMKASW